MSKPKNQHELPSQPDDSKSAAERQPFPKQGGEIDRRKFLRNSAGAIGATAAGGAAFSFLWGGEQAWGQIRWEDEKLTVPITRDSDAGAGTLSRPWSPAEGILHEAPRLALDDEEMLWMTWVNEGETGEQLFLQSFKWEMWGDAIQISNSEGYAAHPAIVASGDGDAFIVWSEKNAENWQLKGRFIRKGKPAEIHTLSANTGVNWQPALHTDGETIHLAWEAKTEGSFWINAISFSWKDAAKGLVYKDPTEVSTNALKDARRPALAEGAVVWDQQDGPGHLAIYLREIDTEGKLGDTYRITEHPAAHLSPTVTRDNEGRYWIAFHSNRSGEGGWDIPRWSYVRCFDPKTKKVHSLENAYGDQLKIERHLGEEGTDQSLEFPRLINDPKGERIILTARPSHNFCVQWYEKDGPSPLFRLPQDGWGGRGQFLSAALDSEGLYLARRDLRAVVLHKLTDLPEGSGYPELSKGRPAQKIDVKSAKKNAPVKSPYYLVAGKERVDHYQDRWPAMEANQDAAGSTDPYANENANSNGGLTEDLNFYYGDLHGHTWMSDGMGDADEYYYTKRDYYHDDFASLTDHDTFVGNSILPSEWEYMKEITDHYNEDGRFVTLFGQEYTTARWPRGIGHKCIYTLQKDTPLFDHTDDESDTSQKLNAHCREWRGLLIPHHVGWTGTDWENFDPQVQRLAEIVSNHGRFEYPGNTPIPHRGNRKGCFIQDAYAMGLKFGLIGGSDSHGLIWHHHAGWKRDCHRTGLAVVLAPELTQEAIFEALWNRRTYATTGTKPRIDFRVNDAIMGSEILAAEDKVNISVNIMAREDIRWVTVVRNNEDWYTYGGDGYTTRFSLADDEPLEGESWYYLRVEFEPPAGQTWPDMAWTSPVWVSR